jgi:hypothetical protein
LVTYIDHRSAYGARLVTSWTARESEEETKMNIDAKFFSAIIFLLVQTVGAIWWASGLTSEVERLAGIQGRAIPALEAEAKQCGIEIHNLKKLTGDQEKVAESVKNLDVMLYRLQTIEQMLDKILATKVR